MVGNWSRYEFEGEFEKNSLLATREFLKNLKKGMVFWMIWINGGFGG